MSIIFQPEGFVGNYEAALESYPDFCPYCLTAISPKQVYSYGFANDETNTYSVNVFYGCPKCAKTFCVRYCSGALAYGKTNRIRLSPEECIPPVFLPTAIDGRIEILFPRSVKVFRQAEKAESFGLVDISGMGYRKALECLIKDSLVSMEILSHDQVRNLDLIKAIQEFKGAPNLYKVAMQARVIGNEYTHYEAKYEGYDISTLKKLLSMTFHWLQMEIDTRELEQLQKKAIDAP